MGGVASPWFTELSVLGMSMGDVAGDIWTTGDEMRSGSKVELSSTMQVPQLGDMCVVMRTAPIGSARMRLLPTSNPIPNCEARFPVFVDGWGCVLFWCCGSPVDLWFISTD